MGLWGYRLPGSSTGYCGLLLRIRQPIGGRKPVQLSLTAAPTKRGKRRPYPSCIANAATHNDTRNPYTAVITCYNALVSSCTPVYLHVMPII